VGEKWNIKYCSVVKVFAFFFIFSSQHKKINKQLKLKAHIKTFFFLKKKTEPLYIFSTDICYDSTYLNLQS